MPCGKSVCNRCWSLLAAHVRTNHVHVVVQAEVQPEKVMNDFKSYASRSLNRLLHDGADRKRWSATEAPDGYGRIRMSGKQSGMSSRSRANPWPSSSPTR